MLKAAPRDLLPPYLLVVATAAGLLAFALSPQVSRRPPTLPPGAAQSDAPGQPVRMLPGPYRAEAIRVVDGDTFEARLRIWFNQDVTVLVRLDGVDAPELRGKCERERRMAVESRAALEAILQAGPVSLSDLRTDKYNGRAVARASVPTADGFVDDVAELLEAGGYARAYDGRARAAWCGPPALLADQGRAR